ncbi:alpha/beta-hydrolase [Linderina pennispora]|uniref:Alpha/beta-hydrolase n=1 Tax=Linderina pennispora TaxID=61395 RepID=A0A1Y1WKP3_9FUNG|nr:alpha/beta-hydrolase [Linderina pennispora]ORX74117.1 alpha/beta-hydrolase [Linderina pennispora]
MRIRPEGDTIVEAISDLVAKFPTFKITFVGHSLGGALASVAAADFMQLFTYGQPRTGNSAYARWIENQGFPISRVVYKKDLVPRVPLQSMGFHHHSEELWYTPAGGFTHCGSNGENPNCQDSVPFLTLDARDHGGYPGLS